MFCEDGNHPERQAGLDALVDRTQAGPRRVLVISPTPVAPLLGGASARIKTLLEALEQLGYEVHLAFVERDGGDKLAMRAMFGERFHPIPYRRQPAEASFVARVRRRLLQAVGVESGWLWDVDDIYDAGIEGPLGQLQARYTFDLVVVEYVFFSRALAVFGPRVRKLIDMHDVFGYRHRMYVAAGQSSHWFSVKPQDEIRALSRADHVLAIQPDEARLMRSRGLRNVDAVSHLVALTDDPGAVPEMPTVLFVGAANESNAHGLGWFVKDVWPTVIAACPDARLHVAGAVSSTCRPAPGVRTEGRVSPERLDALYRRARVAVNPVFTGSGQSIKVLEATGYGVPVVASSVGVRGIAGAGEPGVQVADDPAIFAGAVIRLLCEQEHAAQARDSAYAFARASNAEQLAVLARVCSGSAVPGHAASGAFAPGETFGGKANPTKAIDDADGASNDSTVGGEAMPLAAAAQAEMSNRADEPLLIPLSRPIAH